MTRTTPTADGVDVTITSPNPRARREILVRAIVQSWQRDPIANATEHTGEHGGPGSIGFCPIIHADTTVTYAPIEDGVRVHVAARRLVDVPALQEATAARVRAIARPAS